MKKQFLSAVNLRKFLTTLLVILILGAGAGFYFGMEQVRTFAVEVSHSVTDSNASGKNIEKLQQLKQALAEREELVSKADKLFATDANYQSQALTDVQRYASSYGLTLSNTNFEASDTETVAPTGSHDFTITLKSPVPYDKFLQFLDAVEGNLPKMQIASIEVGRTETVKANEVVVGDIKMTISTR